MRPIIAAAYTFTISWMIQPLLLKSKLVEDLNKIGNVGQADNNRLLSVILERVSDIYKNSSPMRQAILEQRLFSPNAPKTLEQIGKQFGVTRERVRQLEIKLKKKIEKDVGALIQVISESITKEFVPIVTEPELNAQINQYFSESASLFDTLAHQMIKRKIDYLYDGRVFLSKEAKSLISSLRKQAEIIKDDVGIFSEQELFSHLPSDKWHPYRDHLLQCCKFHRVEGEWLSVRHPTAKAQVKAALLGIGSPATKDQIAALCGLKRVGGHLSNISSIVRADKDRWGLKEWVSDVYEGIPAEIVQRINEDGGVTSLKRLLTEIPQMFKVSESSVRSYINTQQFVVRNGYVSLAHESTITYRHLEDVIAGRDKNGNPYWVFQVEERHFRGYSVTYFPPELARKLGCLPNSSIRVKIMEPKDCRDLSVGWRLYSLQDATLGYVADPLDKLEAHAGDYARIVILGSDAVKFQLDDGTSSRKADFGTFLERMKKRHTRNL